MEVATETGIMKYEVERSTDGIVFVKIGEVVSKGLANYTFNDNNLPDGKTIYYRLKILGADGKYKNSSLATVKGNISNASINVFPNPANEKITIKLDKAMEANGLIVIYDIAGKALIFQNITALQTSISIATNHLASGRYFIKISDNKEVINSSFLIAK
ncbi:MAG: T9SS type A sorting domain-containing protein [Chitinophagaceae bacterium]|nr:T9SS type A sorting domain-containing protein [Chitinophagaceae bacterium]